MTRHQLFASEKLPTIVTFLFFAWAFFFVGLTVMLYRVETHAEKILTATNQQSYSRE